MSKKPSSYTTTLCGHVNSIYVKLVQLDRQVKMHCLYPHPQSLNSLKYDSDIDRQTDQVLTPSTAQQSLNAENVQEDITSDATNSEQHIALSPDTDRPSLSPHQFWMIQTIQDTKTPNNQGQNTQATTDSQLEDIPELEDNEEDWEEGQFMDGDFIDHHNTTEESDRIRCEYSAHFEKVTDQGYSTYDSTPPGLEYQIPEPDYYNCDT